MTDHTSSSASPFKPDVVIRRGSVSIEISNTATEELLNKVGGLLHAVGFEKFLLPQGYPHDIFILIFFYDALILASFSIEI